MFLSDISYLQRLNSTKPLSVLESTKGNSTTDQYELELERLFNSSPIITEWTSTYSLSEMYKAESEVSHPLIISFFPHKVSCLHLGWI